MKRFRPFRLKLRGEEFRSRSLNRAIMFHAFRIESDCKRRQVIPPGPRAFFVIPAENQFEVRRAVYVPGQRTRLSMQHLRQHYAASLPAPLHLPQELLGTRRRNHRYCLNRHAG
jgi:hypothetical protein